MNISMYHSFPRCSIWSAIRVALCIFACNHALAATRADYQFVVDSQNPWGRITYDDNSFSNSTFAGYSTGTGSTAWLADYWNTSGANDSISYPSAFSQSSIAGSAINGGWSDAGSTTATGQGTLTLLFRSPGLSNGEADYVFHQHTGTANSFGLRVMGTGAGTGTLQLSVGNILYTGGALANVAGSTWYYFALDFDEATNLVHWSLGTMSGGALTQGTLTMSAAGVVGDWPFSSKSLVFGNTNTNLSTGLNPGDAFNSNSVAGRVDEFSSWNSVLTNAQIQAQFAAINNVVPMPEIAVEQPAGSNIVDGGARNLGAAIVGGTAEMIFTVKNTGAFNLTLTGIPKVVVSGSDAAMFSVTSQPVSPVPGPSGSTTFNVRFAPSSVGAKSASLSIPNNDSDENPFDISLTANGLSFGLDSDGDGLNDATELQLAALGFDWQVNQTALVNTLFSNLGGASANLNTAGYYTTAQIQALNVGMPLIQKDSTTGAFTLTIGVQKSTDLSTFLPFPMSAPQTAINGEGKLEFQFTVPGNAAFFRVQAR